MAKNEPVEFDIDVFRNDIKFVLEKHGVVEIYSRYGDDELIAVLDNGRQIDLGPCLHTGD